MAKRLTTDQKLDLIMQRQDRILDAVQILYKSLFKNDDKVDGMIEISQDNQILLKELLKKYDKITSQFEGQFKT